MTNQQLEEESVALCKDVMTAIIAIHSERSLGGANNADFCKIMIPALINGILFTSSIVDKDQARQFIDQAACTIISANDDEIAMFRNKWMDLIVGGMAKN